MRQTIRFITIRYGIGIKCKNMRCIIPLKMIISLKFQVVFHSINDYFNSIKGDPGTESGVTMKKKRAKR